MRMRDDYEITAGRRNVFLEDSIKEKEIEKIFTGMVKRTGGRAYKWTSPGNAGVPDRIVIFPGRKPLFVELKTSKGRLSRLQEVQCRRLAGLGQEVKVVYGIKGVAGFFLQAGYQDIAEKIARKYGLHADSLLEGGNTIWSL